MRPSDEAAEREWPSNVEAEQALVGQILVDNSAWLKVAGFLRREHFFDATAGLIYEVIGVHLRENQPITGATIVSAVRADPAFDGQDTRHIAQHVAAVVRIGTELRGEVSPLALGNSILEAAQRRDLVLIGRELEKSARSAYVERDEVTGIAQHTVAAEGIAARAALDLSNIRSIDSGQAPTLGAAIDRIEAQDALIQSGNLPAVSVGLRNLDAEICGLPRGDVTIVAGRPGHGKTALAATIALNMARSGIKPAFWSLEMPAEQLGRRMQSMISGVPYNRQTTGRYELGDREALAEARDRLRALPLLVLDPPGLTASRLAIEAQAWHRRGRCDVVIVDYLSYLHDEPGSQRLRGDERIGLKTRQLKMLAKTLDIPVVLLAQLNRDVEKRTEGRKPRLSDLRGSGEIEQDAAIVLFVHREEVYIARERPDPHKEPSNYADWENDLSRVRGAAEIIVAKNRFGPADREVSLRYNGERTLFEDA